MRKKKKKSNNQLKQKISTTNGCKVKMTTQRKKIYYEL